MAKDERTRCNKSHAVAGALASIIILTVANLLCRTALAFDGLQEHGFPGAAGS